MRKNLFGLIISIMLLASMIAACSPGAQVVQNNEPEEVVTEASPVVVEQQIETVEAGGEALGIYGQPIDVPIMDGNRDLQVSNDGENITYKVDGLALQDVMTYYQESLTEAGWEPGPNENPVGTRNLVTLARKNATADRITVTMQNNPIGEFVVVTVVVTRAP
mgnify:CR=1 FL=1